jgi:predicted site-specific integrase-resolvase
MKNHLEISPREAAVRLGIRLDVLYPLLRIGRLQARKKDGRWLVSAADVAKRVQNRFRARANRTEF